MEAQGPVNKILVVTKYCKVHQLKGGKRNSITSGKAIIVQSYGQQQKSVFINVNSFYLNLTPQLQLIRVNYDKSVTYFFQNAQSGAIMSLSFPNINSEPNDATTLTRLQEIIKEKQIAVNFDEDCTNRQLIDKIKAQYPNIESKQIYKPEKVKNVVKALSFGIGGVFGTISSYFQGTGSKIQQKVEQFSRQSISQKKKQKWQSTKNKASEVNQKMTTYIKPVAKKGSEVTKAIKDSWNSTDNKAIKVIKDLTKTTSLYINKGFEKGQGKQQNNDIQILTQMEGKTHRSNINESQSAKTDYHNLENDDLKSEQQSKFGLLDD